MSRFYEATAERAEHRCEYCHAPEIVFNFQFEVEHIVPQSQGGSDDNANLALACHACNLFKSDHQTGSDDVTGDETALFHPRRENWNDHFTVNVTTAQITGRTPQGRATAARLQMNRTRQIAARRRWIVLELFP